MGGDRTGRPDAHEPAASGLRRLARPRLLLSAIAVVSGTVALGAAARTSTTYDEIVLIAGGAPDGRPVNGTSRSIILRACSTCMVCPFTWHDQPFRP